jgi:hypothetical protein
VLAESSKRWIITSRPVLTRDERIIVMHENGWLGGINMP